MTAQHAAVRLICGSAFAPCRDVVGIHLGEFPDAGTVGAVLQGAVGAVAHAFLLSLFGLFGIHPVDGCLVKHADVQQALVLFPTQDILKDTLVIGHKVVSIQFMNSL